MSGKYGLIIANTEYTDPGLAELTAPGKDAEEFWRVLNSPDIGAFDDVMLLLNVDSATVNERIEHFFSEKKPDDLLLLYFSGHGVRDENGALYLAVKNTNRNRLRSTGVSSSFVRDVMDQSRSKRQVLILDCCNSGAFAQGTKAATGVSIGTASAFGAGYGHIVLTASDSTQYAWEGDKIISGETENSLFTHFLVKGLEGEADHDGDGQVSVDELYDYVYEKVKLATPKQTPSKFSTKQQGDILLRQGMRIEDIKPIPLPSELMEEIEDKRSYVREAAVQHLIKLLNGKNLGLARSARAALERIAENDDSRTISRIAFQALQALRQADQVSAPKTEEAQVQPSTPTAQLRREQIEQAVHFKAEQDKLLKENAELEERLKEERSAREKIETDQLTKQKAEENRLALEIAEAERKAKKDAEQLLVEQKAEEKRIAKAQAETERRTKEEADHLAAQKAEEERIEKEKVAPVATMPAQMKSLSHHPTESPTAQNTKIQPTIAPSNKSPIGALALSFILFGGMGQIYLGQLKKGVVLIVITVLTSFIGIGVLIWFYGAIDAYAIAKKMSDGHSVREWEFGFSWKGTLITVLITVALFFLLLIAGLALG